MEFWKENWKILRKWRKGVENKKIEENEMGIGKIWDKKGLKRVKKENFGKI